MPVTVQAQEYSSKPMDKNFCPHELLFLLEKADNK